MPICVNCGNEYEVSLKICPKCGARKDTAPETAPAQPGRFDDDGQVEKMHKNNRRNLIIMSCVFAAFILTGFFVKGQGTAYIIGALLFFPVFVIPMILMKKWAAYVTLIALLGLVLTSMLGLIGGVYSSAPAVLSGIIGSIFFFSYMIVIFQNMDEMR